MNRIILITLLFISCVMANGQDFKKDGTFEEIIKGTPDGYTVLASAKGDLNNDSLKDLIVIFKKDDEEETSDVISNPESRPLLIYFGKTDSAYTLAARNDKVVYCVSCGGVMGDPFQDVLITGGSFTVYHYAGSAWRWSRDVTFKYSSSDSTCYLYSDGGVSFHVSEPDKVTEEIKTENDFGKVKFEDYDIYNGEE